MNDDFSHEEDSDLNEDAGVLALATLEKFLNEDGWHPQEEDEEYVFQAQFVGENGEYSCFFQLSEDLNQFFCYVLAPIQVEKTRRTAVVEYISRANYGLRIGNFELDLDDGEVRYKSSLDFEGENLTDNWLRNAIYPAVYTMDRYMPGLLSVHDGTSPEEAIAEVEE